MAIKAISFGVPTPPPVAPASGKKLFLNSDEKFAAIASDGTITSIGGGVDSYPTLSDFPVIGFPDVLYVDKSNVTAYNWTGTGYVQLRSSLDAGEY